MTLRASQRWMVSAIFGAMAGVALARFGLSAGGIVLAGFALVPVRAVQRMRLSAGLAGVVVVNLGRLHRIAWSEVSDFRMGRVGLSTCLDVWRRDGTRVHAWVATYGSAGYSRIKIDEVVQELRQSLSIYSGESEEDATNRAIQHALVEAEGGRHSEASTLVAEGRIDAEKMARLLVDRRHTKSEAAPPAQ